MISFGNLFWSLLIGHFYVQYPVLNMLEEKYNEFLYEWSLLFFLSISCVTLWSFVLTFYFFLRCILFPFFSCPIFHYNILFFSFICLLSQTTKQKYYVNKKVVQNLHLMFWMSLVMWSKHVLGDFSFTKYTTWQQLKNKKWITQKKSACLGVGLWIKTGWDVQWKTCN